MDNNTIFPKTTNFTIEWIKGHSNTLGNELADALATNSAKKFKDIFKNTVNNGIVLYDGDIKIVDDILYLPLFLIDYLK